MTTGSEIYLAIIVAAFLTYSVTLFWAMATGGGSPNVVDERHPTER